MHWLKRSLRYRPNAFLNCNVILSVSSEEKYPDSVRLRPDLVNRFPAHETIQGRQLSKCEDKSTHAGMSDEKRNGFPDLYHPSRPNAIGPVSSMRLSPAYIDPCTAVEDIIDIYNYFWIESRRCGRHDRLDPGGVLLEAFQSVDTVYQDHCIRRGFESLLLFALDTPRAIDFLLVTCWQTMRNLGKESGETPFIKWLQGLPIVPQPINPILGDPQFMRQQSGIVKTSKAKRSARIVTAAILSRCLALGILTGSDKTTMRCHTNEASCLKRHIQSHEVDFIASCIYFRGCAKSFSEINLSRQPQEIVQIHKAVLQDWRYHSNFAVGSSISNCPASRN